MLRYERDYLMRMIAAAMAAVARLRQRLVDGAPALEIVQESRAAQTELLGRESALLRVLDPASAVHAIGDTDRIVAWIALLRVEADALRAAGEPDAARAAEDRARALEKHAEVAG